MTEQTNPSAALSEATQNPAPQASPAPQATQNPGPETSVDTRKAANAAPQEQARPLQKQPTEPRTVLVLDTTAVEGPRTHAQLVNGRPQNFTFKPNEPLSLSPAIAAKFLKHDGFRMVDAAGQMIEYKRQPKQPEELGAGEQLQLSENETIARYDELTTMALAQRAAELPGGETFMERPDKPSREELIAFLIKAIADKRARNIATKPDLSDDDFVPEPEVGDEAA